MKVNRIRKLFSPRITKYAEYLNVYHSTIYNWKDLPPKYIRPTIEFLEGVADDLVSLAIDLAKEEKTKKENVKS